MYEYDILIMYILCITTWIIYTSVYSISVLMIQLYTWRRLHVHIIMVLIYTMEYTLSELHVAIRKFSYFAAIAICTLFDGCGL